MSSRPAIWQIPSAKVKDLVDYTEAQALRIIKDTDWAQEAAAQVLEKLAKLEVWPQHEKAWIQTALKNALIDRKRLFDEKKRVDPPRIRNDKDPFAEAADIDEFFRQLASYQRTSETVFLTEIWRKLCDSMSEKEFLLLLAEKNGYSHKQIAEQLGYASAASVSQTLSRLRKKIQPILEAWEYKLFD